MAVWDEMQHIRKGVSFTKAHMIMHQKLVGRGQAAQAYAASPAECRAAGRLARFDLARHGLEGDVSHGGNVSSASRSTRNIFGDDHARYV